MKIISSLKQDLQSKNLGTSLAVGFVLGVFTILGSIMPIAALIFSGEIQGFIGVGIGILLSTNIIISIVSSLGSSFKFALARPVNNPVFAVIATFIVSQGFSQNATIKETITTIIMALALTSVLTGVTMFLLGKFKLADLTRFMPYPIFAALIAGLGFLLMKGSITVMTGISIDKLEFSQLFQNDLLLRWLPGTFFAVTLYILFTRYNHFLLLPGSILVAIALFYFTIFITNTSFQEISDGGWLLGPFSDVNTSGLNYFNPSQANWSLVFANFTSMISIAIYTILRAPIVCNSAELMSGEEIDLNQELRSVGLANILSGFAGGSVGCYSMVPIRLAYQMGAKNSLIGLFHAIPSIIILLFGVSLLSYVPKLVVGGLLLFLGMSMFIDELYKQWFKVSKWDYILILLIVITIVNEGLFEGVIVGLVRASIFFAIRASQFDVIKNEFSAVEHPSIIKRPFKQEKFLSRKRQTIYIYQLEGFIFFGNAHKVISKMTQDLLRQKEIISFVILDCQFLKDLDASGMESILKLKRALYKEKIYLLFTQLKPKQEKLLHKSKVIEKDDLLCELFIDLNDAIKWCENKILSQSDLKEYIVPSFFQQLDVFFTNSEQIKIFMGYWEKLILDENEYIFKQQDKVDYLYFIESGQIKKFINLDNSGIKPLQILQGETTLGEIAFYNRTAHQNSAITEQPTTLYRLSVDSFKMMEKEHPELANILNKIVIFNLSKFHQA